MRYTMTASMRIGIDLGGTKIEGIAIAHTGEELLRRRIAAPRGDYADTLAAVTGLIRDIETEVGVRGTVGIGIPGTISPATGLIKNSNSTWLNGRALAADLPRLLDREIRFANDANCFALSEATDGAAAGARVVFGVIVGTGTGGGVVIDRQVLVGANAIGGEWGHNPLPGARGSESPGPACYCGRHGCIEQFLSGPALAGSGDAAADAALSRYEERMARALGSIINLLDPDVIVLGGGLSNIDRLYHRVPKLWSKYIFSDHVVTRQVRAKHGDSSGVRGAAWLWDDDQRGAR